MPSTSLLCDCCGWGWHRMHLCAVMWCQWWYLSYHTPPPLTPSSPRLLQPYSRLHAYVCVCLYSCVCLMQWIWLSCYVFPVSLFLLKRFSSFFLSFFSLSLSLFLLSAFLFLPHSSLFFQRTLHRANTAAPFWAAIWLVTWKTLVLVMVCVLSHSQAHHHCDKMHALQTWMCTPCSHSQIQYLSFSRTQPCVCAIVDYSTLLHSVAIILQKHTSFLICFSSHHITSHH